MFIRNQLRFNIYAGAVIDGVRYANFLDPELRAQLGITEIADPLPPPEYLANPDYYIVTEQDAEPYVAYSRKSDEQIAEIKAHAKAKRWEDIKAIRDRKTQQGGYKAGGDWFHSDTFSRTQQIGLTIMGAAMPAGIMWKTMAGSFVEMTPTLAQQIFAAAGVQDALLFAHAEQLKAQVEASDDPASVDIGAGWPETFNGV